MYTGFSIYELLHQRTDYIRKWKDACITLNSYYERTNFCNVRFWAAEYSLYILDRVRFARTLEILEMNQQPCAPVYDVHYTVALPTKSNKTRHEA
jgi:hypothetical protein